MKNWLYSVFCWLTIATVWIKIGIVEVSTISPNNRNNSLDYSETNSSSMSKTFWPFELDWIYLFLYTLSVATISYYLGNILTLSNTVTPSSFTLSTIQYNRLKNKYFQVRNNLKFILLSRLIHRNTTLDELKKLCSLTSSAESVSVPDKDILGTKYEQQKNELIDAILNGYIFSWFNKISDEKSFPIFSKQILISAFTQLEKKVERINRTVLAKEIILLLHCHWMKYCDMLKKNNQKQEKSITVQNFRAIHSYFCDKEEIAKQYQALIAMSLKEILVPELQTSLFCQFLSGIFVKGFVFYYAERISDPMWLNSNLVSIISSTEPTSESFIKINDSKSVTPTNINCYDDSKENNANCLDENMEKIMPSTSEIGKCDEVVAALSNDLVDDQPNKLMNGSEFENCSNNLTSLFHTQPSGKAELGWNNQQTTISSVLSGLLSTTAIPLLPEGSKYDLSAVNVLQESSPIDAEEVKDNNNANETATQQSSSQEILETDKAKGPSHNSRHFSANEPPAQRESHFHPVKTTQSLDDNKTTHKVVRQEEFDSLFEASDKLKIDSAIKKSASPMYEDVEDFASTIAKLRSLLEQKQSRTNLLDITTTDVDNSNGASEVFKASNQEQSPTTIPNGKNDNCSSGEESTKSSARQNLNSQSSISSSGADGSSGSSISQSIEIEKMDTIEDELEENEICLRRIFLNVVISKTETCGESSAQSILFCIQYEGVYVHEDDYDNSQKLVLRTTTVKRRFKEFLTLQNQLEENPILKPHLKHIKTPSKWLTLSFPNQNSINQRKVFLEKYLQQLCYHPILGFSPEVRQFMAYGEDGFRAFEMLTSNTLSFHRLDKIAKTFTGVFNSLKDVLPSFEGDAISSAPASPNDVEHKGRLSPSDPKAKKLFTSLFNFGEKVTAQKVKNEQAMIEVENSLKSPCKDPNIGLDKVDQGGDNQEEQANPGEEAELLLDGSLESLYPLASVFTQFLCDVLWLPPQRPHSASIAAFMSISGKSLENYLQESLRLLSSEDAFTVYLNWLTGSINEWMTATEETFSINLEETLPNSTVEDLKHCLRERVPVWARWMWGRKRLDLIIDRLAGFCQYVELNHDFVLSVVELIFSKMTDCDEIYNNTAEAEI